MLVIKMMRDLKQNITQFMAIFIMSFISLVVVAGTGVSDYRSINEYMQDTSYKDLDLSGITFSMGDLEDVAALDEVRAVDGYYNTSGKITSSDDVKVLISYITGNEVSRLYITEGEAFSPGSQGVWIDKNLADFRGIGIGDTIEIFSEDQRFTEVVRGICYSSQYLYYAVDSTYVEPDYSQYGFVFMDISRCPADEIIFDELLIDLSGVSGELYLTESDRICINRAKKKISLLFDSPALIINEKKEDYQLNTYVEAVDTNKVIQTLFPAVFASISLLGILTTMTRLVARQRTTIGALKALGFTGTTITFHYMSYGLVIVFLGCITGALTGYYALGPVMYDTMTYYYLNPYERLEVSGNIYIFTIVLLLGAALVSYLSNHRILSLSASQILQPSAPKSSKKSWYEGLYFWKALKFATQWNIRDISGNFLRSVMSVLGIVVCSGLLFGSFGFYECLNRQGSWLYGQLIMAKNKVEFSDDADYGTVYDYASEYKGQMVQMSPIRLKGKLGEKNTNMYITDKGNNYFLHDLEGEYTDLPQNGVAITKKMMEMTGISPGDTISWNISGEKEIYHSVVRSVVRTPLDQGIYMTRDTFEALRGSFVPNVLYTGLFVPKDIEDRPEIVSVNTTEDLAGGMDSSNASYVFIVAIMIILAVLLGSVILYNLGTMSYNEKLKDMVTLKVLGFRSKDLKFILMQQNLFITGIGTVFGVFLGFGIIDILSSVFGEDVDCLVSLSPAPYIADILFTFVLSIIINVYITSKLEDIDMVETLKGV